MSYRFLTEQEFKEKGEWKHTVSAPKYWNPDMNKYLGQPVPKENWEKCKQGVGFYLEDLKAQTTWWIKPEEYCEDTFKPRFKKGDKVRINDTSEHFHQGTNRSMYLIGTIDKVEDWRTPNPDDYIYIITWSDGKENGYRDTDLLPWEASWTTPKPSVGHKFKIGDRVKVVKSGHGFSASVVGAECIIEGYGDYGGEPGYEISWPVINKEDIPRYSFNGLEKMHGEESFELASTVQIAYSSQDILLSKAIDKYPVGTKFVPSHIKVHGDAYCIITVDTVIKWVNNEIIATINGKNYVNPNLCEYGNSSLNRVLYSDKGDWAIKLPEDKISEYEPGNFEVGDYIISLKTVGKDRKEGELFTALSFSVNGNAVYYKKNVNGYKESFRRAYPYEIAHYLKPIPIVKDPTGPSYPEEKKKEKLIEPVHSVSVKLSTKKKKFKF